MADDKILDETSEAVIKKTGQLAPGAAPGKLISDAAKRALHEAQARREAAAKAKTDHPRLNEYAGPKGAEPTRFGDWERGGIAYDF